MEMTCSNCNHKGHNKRKCPEPVRVQEGVSEAPGKKARGRPRNDGKDPGSVPPTHHSVSAQPTRIGQNGRTIRGGRGSRGGRSKGGKGGTPRGFGVLISSDGTPLLHLPGQRGGPTVATECSFPASDFPGSSQASNAGSQP